jgi:hypothetical protein
MSPYFEISLLRAVILFFFGAWGVSWCMEFGLIFACSSGTRWSCWSWCWFVLLESLVFCRCIYNVYSKAFLLILSTVLFWWFFVFFVLSLFLSFAFWVYLFVSLSLLYVCLTVLFSYSCGVCKCVFFFFFLLFFFWSFDLSILVELSCISSCYLSVYFVLCLLSLSVCVSLLSLCVSLSISICVSLFLCVRVCVFSFFGALTVAGVFVCLTVLFSYSCGVCVSVFFLYFSFTFVLFLEFWFVHFR